MKSLCNRLFGTILGCALIAGGSVGCQSTGDSQVISDSRDDFYMGGGPDDHLTNQKAAIESYNAQRAGLADAGDEEFGP